MNVKMAGLNKDAERLGAIQISIGHKKSLTENQQGF
jgi:hypothetical protein